MQDLAKSIPGVLIHKDEMISWGKKKVNKLKKLQNLIFKTNTISLLAYGLQRIDFQRLVY